MTKRWLNLTDAAAALNVSSRTLTRRISAGSLSTRLSEGTREVLVDVVDTAEDLLTDSMTAIAEHDHRQTQMIEKLAVVMARPAEQAESMARRSRLSAGLGWTVVAALLVVVGFGIRQLTLEQSRADHLATMAKHLDDKLADTLIELTELTDTLADTKLRTEGLEKQVAAERERSATLTDTLEKAATTVVPRRIENFWLTDTLPSTPWAQVPMAAAQVTDSAE